MTLSSKAAGLGLGRIGIWSTAIRFAPGGHEGAAELEALGFQTIWIPGGIDDGAPAALDRLLDATARIRPPGSSCRAGSPRPRPRRAGSPASYARSCTWVGRRPPRTRRREAAWPRRSGRRARPGFAAAYFGLRFARRLRLIDSARLRVACLRRTALRFETLRFERFPGGVGIVFSV